MIEVMPGLRESEYEVAFAAVPLGLPQATFDNANFLRFKTPRDRKTKIQKAKEYRNIDLVNRIIRIKTDFGLKFKGIKVNNKNKTLEKKQQKFYEEKVFPLITRIADQWEKEHNSVGDTYLHFGFEQDDRTPMFLTIEDPEVVEAVTLFGREKYKIQLSGDFMEKVNDLRKQGMLSVLPSHIAKQLSENRKYIKNHALTLTNENMFRTSNLRSDYETYSEPPLMSISEALELRKLLTNADFVAAYSAGSEIIHTKVGTEKEPKDDKQVGKIHQKLTQNPPGVFYFTTRHDVEINRIPPNTELWNADKYKECNERILQWSGISVTLINGEGSAYGSAVVSVKGFQQAIQSDRKEFERFANHFFEEINKRNGWAGSKVKLIYDRDALITSEEFLNELKYLVGMGIKGIEDICFDYDLDYEEQLEKKKKQKKDEEYFQPHFEMNQGLIGEEGGRPKTNPDNPRDTNQPRPGS